MPPPAFQRAERAARDVRYGPSVPSPDAALGDGDGAAHRPYHGLPAPDTMVSSSGFTIKTLWKNASWWLRTTRGCGSNSWKFSTRCRTSNAWLHLLPAIT